MNLKKIIPVSLFLTATCFTLHAHATSVAKSVFDGVYPGNTTDCYVCHTVVITGSPVIKTTYGTDYVNHGGLKDGLVSAIKAIEKNDADADTTNNVLEIRTGTNPIAANNPLGVSATSAATGDILVQGTNVGTISITPIVDVYAEMGVTLASGQEILSGAKLNFTLGSIAPVTITFSSAGATGTVQVHELTGTGTSTPIAATTSSGSITYTPTSTNETIAIEHTAAVAATPASADTQGGCFAGMLTPFSMAFVLLSLGFFTRKKD